ncbi:MAG TPA: hypothetical protein VF376_00560 [Thermoanaerobaculia bacterium]
MAPVEQYRIANREEEIALARSAAPPSVSADAEVLVLGSRGYETAVKGKNGFVCFVERSWAARFAPHDESEFWNPHGRAPNCYNPPAVRTVLPQILRRTEWALAGATKQQMIERSKAEFATGHFTAPEAGAYSFMLSKQGHLGDDGPWLPHIMLFLPPGHADSWGTNLEGSPIFSVEGIPVEATQVFIPVRTWSDGSLAPLPKEHTM